MQATTSYRGVQQSPRCARGTAALCYQAASLISPRRHRVVARPGVSKPHEAYPQSLRSRTRVAQASAHTGSDTAGTPEEALSLLPLVKYNVRIAKTLKLAIWVSTQLQESDGTSLTTSTLFERFQHDIPKQQRVSEAIFTKEIEPLMRAYGWNVYKTKTDVGRGYAGVSFIKS